VAEQHATVLIVGAGAAGGVAALCLAQAGVDVVCLEQGGWPDRGGFRGGEPEGDLIARGPGSSSPVVRHAPQDYPIDTSDSDLAVVNWNGVGGGTVLYNAQWPRMLPDDFRVGTVDGVARDWPVTYAELAPFYERIDRQFTVSGLGGNPAFPEGADPPLPPLPIGRGGLRVARAHAQLGWHWWPETNAIASVDVDETRHRCAQRGTCSQGCGEGAKASTDLTHWPQAIAAGARLITRARVREILIGRDGRAQGAVWLDEQRREHRQTADFVLLAANGIGTPRLLLNSANTLFPDGVANSSGLVGRRLMLHPLATVTGMFGDDLESWRGQSGALIQSTEFYASDPSRGFLRGARWSLTPGGGALKTVLAPGASWGDDHHAYLRERLGRSVSWVILGEDLPDEDNRVSIDSGHVDSWGIAGAALHYRISDNSRTLIDWHCVKATESLRAAGAHLTEVQRQPANGHFMGTACMGDDPRSSVVDQWGISHDVPNLGIIDGSVFVTAGGVNPTATICALALRAVEHLIQTRGAGERRRPRQVPADPVRQSTPTVADGVVTLRLDGPDHLSGPDRGILAELADLMIPARAGMPSASEVGVHAQLLDRVFSVRPDLLLPVRRAVRWRRDLHDESVVDLATVLDWGRHDTAAFTALRQVVAGGYYMSSDVRALLEYPDDVSQPVPPFSYPAYIDEGLLDHLLASVHQVAIQVTTRSYGSRQV
jgi:choline dehydrogenase-like flavoprotein